MRWVDHIVDYIVVLASLTSNRLFGHLPVRYRVVLAMLWTIDMKTKKRHEEG